MNQKKIFDTLQKVNQEYITKDYCDVWKPTVNPQLKILDFLTKTLDNQLDVPLTDQLKFVQELGTDQQFRKTNLLSYIEAWLYCQLNDLLNKKKEGRKTIQEMIHKFIGLPGSSIKDFIRNIGSEKGFQETELENIYPMIQNNSYYKEYLTSLEEIQEQTQISTQVSSIDKAFIYELFENSIEDESKIPAGCPQSLIEQLIQTSMMDKYSFLKGQRKNVTLKDLKQFLQTHLKINSKMNYFMKEITKNPMIQLEILYGIRKQICEINIYELQRLIRKTEKAKQQIRNQEIIFCIGTTGAGKTTTILKALGYSLKESWKNKLRTLEPEQELKKEHQSLLTSPESKSITRHIFACKVPEECFALGKYKEIYICDSPGFGDSAGVEVDIANGIGMIQGIFECKSVRIALVVSAKSWGDRGQGPKELGKIVSELFNDYEAIEESVSFIFNKFTENEKNQLPAKCLDLLKNMTEIQKGYEKYRSFLSHLNTVADCDKKIMMKPLQIDSKVFIKEIMLSKPIKDPKQHFKYSFTDKTKQSIKSTIQNYAKLIMESFNEKKYNFTAYYAELLNKFINLINSVEGKQIYKNCISRIEKEVKVFYDSFEKNLKQRVLKNQTNQDNIIEMKECQNKMKETQCLSKIAEIPTIIQLRQMKIQQSNKLLLQLEKDEIALEFIRAGKLFAKYFDDQLDQKIHRIISQKYTAIQKKLMVLIKSETYEELKIIWEKYTVLSTCMRIIELNKDVEQSQLKVKQKLEKNISNYVKIIEEKLMISLLNQNTTSYVLNEEVTKKLISKESIDETKQILQKLNLIMNAFLPNSEDVRNLRTKIINLTIMNARKMLQKSNDTIYDCEQTGNALEDKVCRTIKNCQINAKTLTGLEEIKDALGSQVKNSHEKMKNLINNQMNNLSKIIEAFKGDNIDGIKGKLIKIKQIIARVKSLSQLGQDETLVTAADNLEREVRTSIQQYLTLQHVKAKKLSLTLRFCTIDRIQKNLSQLSQIQLFKKYVNITQEIKMIIAEIEATLQNNLIAPINQINNKSQQIKENYNFFKLGIDNYQLFSVYLNSLNQNNINGDIDQTIKVILTQIIDNMKIPFVKMGEQLNNELEIFQKNLSNRENIQKIRNIIRIINIINNKTHFSMYLNINNIYDTQNILEKIVQNIMDKVNKLRIDFQEIKNCNNTKAIQEYHQMSKSLQEIDRQLPMRNQGLGELVKQIQSELISCQGNLTDLIEKAFPADKNQINEQFLKQAYKQILENNTGELIKKRQYIQNKMLELQQRIQKNIQSCSTTLNFGEEDGDRRGAQRMLLENLENGFKFKEIVESIIKDQNDRKWLSINDEYLSQSGLNMFEALVQNYTTIIELIKEYCFKEVKERIKTFRVNEKIIVKIMSKDLKFRQLFLKKIEQFFWEEDEPNMKFTDGTIITLSSKLELIVKIEQEKIKKSLQENHIKIDKDLTKYFDKAEQQTKNIISAKVKNQIKDQLQQYQSKYSQDCEKAEQKLMQLKYKIGILPNQLKIQMENLVEQVKNNILLREQSQTQIFEMNTNQAFPMIQAIEKISEAHHKGNKNMQKKVKECLKKQLNKAIMKSNLSTNQTLKIFQEKFLITYESSKNKIQSVESIKQIYEQKEKAIIQKILSDVESKCAKFWNVVGHKFEVEQLNKLNIKNQENVSCIFKVYECFIKSQGKLITKQSQKINDKFDLFMNQVIDEYTKRLIQLNPQMIWKAKTVMQRQNTVTLILKARSISEQFILIQKQCQCISIQQNQMIKKCLEAYRNCQTYEKKFQKIINKMKQAKENIEHFEICGDNMINSSEEGIANCLQQVQNQFTTIERIQFILNDTNQIKRIKQIKVEEVKEQFHTIVEQKIKQAIKQAENCFQTDDKKSVKVDVVMRIMKTIKKKNINVIKFNVNPMKSIHDKMQEQYKIHSKSIEQKLKNMKLNAQKYAQSQIEWSKKINENLKNKQIDFEKQRNQKLQRIKKQKFKLIDAQQDQIKKQTIKEDMESQMNKVKEEIEKKKQDYESQIQNQMKMNLQKMNNKMLQDMKWVADQLINLKKTNFLIQQCYKQESDKMLKDNLKKLKQFSKRTLTRFIEIIKEHEDQTYAQMLISESDVFKVQNAQKFQKLVQNQGIVYVLENISVEEEKKKQLSRYFQGYESEFNKQLKYYSEQPNQVTINILADSIKTNSKKLHKFYIKEEGNPGSDIKYELLAQIFALWTISKADVSEGEVIYLYKPHPAQVVTIFLLLSMGNKTKDQSLRNIMAQVGTGQGKSVILAGICTYLALVGYQVCCACYSAYLSGRDQQAFQSLFKKLDVYDKIKYGTFNDHCKAILNPTSDESFEGMIQKYINYQKEVFEKVKDKFEFSKIFKKSGKKNNKILIIDEVDVFFDQKFFGQIYCPSITLKDKTIDSLLQYVWNKITAYQETMPQEIIKSDQFKNVVKKYPNLKQLLINQIHGMVAGARGYQHQYLVVNNRIVYKDNDTISESLNYGFKTVFANLKEFRKNAISQLAWKAALQISLITAEFSYAELPNFFDVILGVTGTLQIMPEYKKKQLKQRYKVGQMFVIPSVYGNQKRRVQNYKITNHINHYEKVIQNVKKHFEKKQPIIIFFRTAKDVLNFYSSQQFKNYKSNATFLTQQHDAETRNQRIKRASQSKQITLFTDSFGRGTDFIIYNKAIQVCGGLHVIQAYLSIDESQEVQVKGRTARQGKVGSYDLIIPENELQLIGISKINEQKIVEELWEGRRVTSQKKSKTILQNLNVAYKKHQQVVDLYSSNSINQQRLIDYIYTLNKFPQVTRLTNRTILALDATCSMGHAMAKVLTILDAAFTRTYEVLEVKKVKGTLQLQTVIYRNYNSDAMKILQATSFENKSYNIKEFLKTVTVSGGWGHEAVQVCLRHINMQPNIDQVILIADAAANTPQQTILKRNLIGEKYWLQNNYPMTDINKQTEKIINSKVPIHTFYLAQQEYFKQLSARTNGQSQLFRINEANASEKLAAFIVENVLFSIGGKQNGQALVQEYRKRFK